jgi:LPS-assembly lipoprotein
MPQGRRAWLWCAGGLALAGLSGCGFKLRQAPQLAFHTLVLSAPQASPLVQELRAALVATGVTVLDAMPVASQGVVPVQVDAVLEVLLDLREKAVVGINSAGQVTEFQLRHRARFRLRTPRGKDLMAESEISLQRDVSYSESVALSKAEEEQLLYRDMQTDLVQQLMRRLAAVRSL